MCGIQELVYSIEQSILKCGPVCTVKSQLCGCSNSGLILIEGICPICKHPHNYNFTVQKGPLQEC